MKKLIVGTTNPAKVDQIQGALKLLDLLVQGILPDAEVPEIIEDGETSQENAQIKALAYAKALGGKVFSIDNALFLDGLKPHEQPGVHVRRIGGRVGRCTDEELIAHYSLIIARLGGRTTGRWDFGVCIAKPDGTANSSVISSPRQFTSFPSRMMIPGFPLESLQIDPVSGQYISEMTQDEKDTFWQIAIGKPLAAFVEEHILD